MSSTKELREKHGTPREFATAVWRAVPWDISAAEAAAAIAKYEQEWREAEANDDP